jgi:hypothetical protein
MADKEIMFYSLLTARFFISLTLSKRCHWRKTAFGGKRSSRMFEGFSSLVVALSQVVVGGDLRCGVRGRLRGIMRRKVANTI